MQNLNLKLLHHVLAGAGIAKVPILPCSRADRQHCPTRHPAGASSHGVRKEGCGHCPLFAQCAEPCRHSASAAAHRFTRTQLPWLCLGPQPAPSQPVRSGGKESFWPHSSWLRACPLVLGQHLMSLSSDPVLMLLFAHKPSLLVSALLTTLWSKSRAMVSASTFRLWPSVLASLPVAGKSHIDTAVQKKYYFPVSAQR